MGPGSAPRPPLVFAGQSVVVRVSGDPDGNDGRHYLYSDHLGSASAMQKDDGSAPIITRYLPLRQAQCRLFGGYRASSGTNEVTDRGFTGQPENMSLGLYYYQARFYVPGIGRFASADTIVPDPARPQSYNRYSYVENRPLVLTDPTGHQPSNGCNYEGCATDDDEWEANLFNYMREGRAEYLRERNAWLSQLCISLGGGCSAELKFRLFGIPTTDDHWNILIATEAHNLCYAGSGKCSTKQVGVLLSAITLGLGGSVGLISTGYDVGEAALRSDWTSAGQEVGFDIGGYVTDAAMEYNGLPEVGGLGWGVVDTLMDIGGLSSLEQEYIGQARRNVDLQVNQAQAEFMYAHNAFIRNQQTSKTNKNTPFSFFSVNTAYPWH